MRTLPLVIGCLMLGSASHGAETAVESTQARKERTEALKQEFHYAGPVAAPKQTSQAADPDVVVMDKYVVTDSGFEKKATAAIEDARQKEEKEKFTNATGGRIWKKDIGGHRIELGLTPAGHSSFKILNFSWGGRGKR